MPICLCCHSFSVLKASILPLEWKHLPLDSKVSSLGTTLSLLTGPALTCSGVSHNPVSGLWQKLLPPPGVIITSWPASSSGKLLPLVSGTVLTWPCLSTQTKTCPACSFYLQHLACVCISLYMHLSVCISPPGMFVHHDFFSVWLNKYFVDE